MRTIQKTVYLFSELSDSAKEKARNWYRELGSSDCDSVISDFEQVAAILGLHLDQTPIKTMSGKERLEPAVYYSVAHCQGDFAAFSGTWVYAKGSIKRIKEYAPEDEGLHVIAEQWANLQKRNFYSLSARVSYHHYYGQRVDYTTVNNRYSSDDVLDDAHSLAKDLAAWLYRKLRDEVEYQNSDEAVDEAMEANDYEFYLSGEKV